MADYFKNKKILLTGGAGFVGRQVANELKNRGVTDSQIVIPHSAKFDLRSASVCQKVTKEIDLVIHLISVS
jgi:GDP-L-fucose synthase